VSFGLGCLGMLLISADKRFLNMYSLFQVSWTFVERLIDATVGILIPFLHEIKCLFILLLIITRPWVRSYPLHGCDLN